MRRPIVEQLIDRRDELAKELEGLFSRSNVKEFVEKLLEYDEHNWWLEKAGKGNERPIRDELTYWLDLINDTGRKQHNVEMVDED